MIEVTKLKVRSFDLSHLDIFWEIDSISGASADGQNHAVYDYDFYVLRSGDSPLGPYHQIAGPLRDQYMLRDPQVSLLHDWRQYFYKIKVVHRPTGEEREFGPTSSSEPEPDLIAAEIMRNQDIVLREFNGRKCWLFIARTFGPRCTCWDARQGRRTRSGHALCFDTGFLGGYMSPIECYVQIDNPEKDSVAKIGARMIAFPPVSQRDILIETENRRWRVLSVRSTQRLRAVVHQELMLEEIPKADIEYSLPLNVDIQNLNPAADRNFTNPQNLESSVEINDILSFWKPRGSLR